MKLKKNNRLNRPLAQLVTVIILGGASFTMPTSFVAAANVTTSFSGSLDGSTTYTRPTTVNGAASGWAAGGSTYNYFTEEFTPSGTAAFDINVLGTSTINDPVLYLYSGSFDPSSPLTNGIIANDDGGAGLLPKITAQTLTGDTTYIIVVTSFTAGDTGTFDFSIVGPFGVAVGASGYVDTASPTGVTTLANYFSDNDDSGDRQAVATHLDTLDEAELITALKTIFPVNTSSNAQSLVAADVKTTGTLLNKIGTVLGSTSASLDSLSVSGNDRDYGGWIFGHQKTDAELAQDPTLSLASGAYKKFKPGTQGIWGEVVVADTNGEGTANSLGYDGISRGLVMGFEQALNETVMLGLLTGYYRSNVDLDSNAGQTEANTYNVGVYGQKLLDGVKLSGVLLFGYGDYDAERLIDLGGTTATPSADYSSKSLSGTLNISKLYTHEGVKIEPFLSGSLSNTWVAGYSETGGGAFNMQVGDDRFSYGGVRLGVTLQKSFALENDSALNFKLMPYMGRNWQIEGAQTSVSVVGGSGSTVINGQSLTTYEAGLSGEVAYDMTPATTFKVGFDVSSTKYEETYLGFLGFGVKF